MASGPPLHYDPLRDKPATPLKRVRSYLVKDVSGERLELKADEVSTSKEMLMFWLEGQLVACINAWLWYRVHEIQVPKLDPVSLKA